ncbi:hypothetical protein L2E82_35922 [Cichorium intybus]|uniref:Uncharacterized protein n=1 Tax=Cichorium intybus TaxID=13427 RepID=A0ACB9BQ98_CICIN|nr:hypothetical protein L2E82_35922 [Cichorium intybus]
MLLKIQGFFRRCVKKNGKSKAPTPDMVRLMVKASEALLGILPKKERDTGSPLITVMVGDVVIRNTLLDLGASVNVLPGYFYDKYKNEELEPAKTVLYLEDVPALILGRPFFATAGAVMDCKTGYLDISFGTRKHRLNMFGSPISLPQGYEDKYWNNSLLMAPGTRDKGKTWTRGGGKEEILRETKDHPLSTVDKVQLLDMMEMMELRHQQYEKHARCREAKVFQLLDAQQQWISQVSDRMTQLTSLLATMVHNFAPDMNRMIPWEDHEEYIGSRQVWGHTKDFGKFEGHAAVWCLARRAYAKQPDAQGLDWGHARRSSSIPASRETIGQTLLYKAGLWGELEPFIHRTWSAGEFTFTCHGWERLMANQEDIVYTELLLEFLSTVHYAPASREARSKLISFRLGGVSRDCSLQEFGRCSEIYTEEDLQSRHFTPFLQACIQGQPDRAANATIWATLSNVQFEAGSARESQLRNPFHRLMHRIISTFIMQKQGGEKVSDEDMTYMWVLLDPTDSSIYPMLWRSLCPPEQRVRPAAAPWPADITLPVWPDHMACSLPGP